MKDGTFNRVMNKEVEKLKREVLSSAKNSGRMAVCGNYTSEDHAMDNARKALDKLIDLVRSEKKGKL